MSTTRAPDPSRLVSEEVSLEQSLQDMDRMQMGEGECSEEGCP